MLDKSHGHLGFVRDRARRSSTGGWSRQRGAAPTRRSVSVATVRSPRSRARPAHRRRQHCRPRPRRADPSATGPGGRSCSPRSGQAQPVNRRAQDPSSVSSLVCLAASTSASMKTNSSSPTCAKPSHHYNASDSSKGTLDALGPAGLVRVGHGPLVIGLVATRGHRRLPHQGTRRG